MVKMATKREYINTVRIRYEKAKNRQEKSQIINEVVENLKKDRKYVIKIMNGQYYKKRRKYKPRPPTYPYDLKVPLKEIWKASGKPCSKNFKPQIPEMLRKLKQFNEISVTPEQEHLLCKMGTSTIDRFLNYIKYKDQLKGLSGTKRSPLLKTLIPIRTNFDDVDEPGHVEQDCVLHCGMSTAGKYAESLDTLDIDTHWNELYCFLHKTKTKVVGAFHITRKRFPFPILSTDFDNGYEFINKCMYSYCAREGIDFTRSRPYKKNDQAHVEGKNYQSIRRVIGYDRIESQDIVDLINDIYANEFRLLNNFFYTTRKLESKVRKNGKITKRYGKAKTPYRRVLESDKISKETKQQLMKQYEQLNPAQLQRTLHINLQKLKKMISVSESNQATIPTQSTLRCRFSPGNSV